MPNNLTVELAGLALVLLALSAGLLLALAGLLAAANAALHAWRALTRRPARRRVLLPHEADEGTP